MPEEIVNKDRNAIFKWVKTSIDEGNEGPVQNVLTQLISKAVYEPAKPMFSLTDQDAVFNPGREATQWAGGTFAGGILSAFPIAANKLVNDYNYDSSNEIPRVMLNEGQNMFYGDLAEGYAPENLHSTQAITIEDGNLDLAQEHLKDAAFAKDFAETPESFKNNLMTAYRSAGNTRQVKVESGAMDGAPYDVTINKSTVENVVGNPKVTAAELAVLKNLDAIVKNSTYVESNKGASLSVRNQPVRHDYFETPVTLGGETYIVRLDVAVKKSSANIKPQSVVEGIEVVRATDSSGEKAGNEWNSAETTSGKDLPKWPETFEELLALPEKPQATPGELPDLASNGLMGYNEGAGYANKLLKQSTCSSDDFYKYLNKINSDYADNYEKTGKWPFDVQIPKSPDVLKVDGVIDWSKAPQAGYVLDSNGDAIKTPHLPEVGEIIDRHGPDSGRFTSPVENNKPYSYAQRSLPYLEDSSQYHKYKVVGDFSKLELYVKEYSNSSLKKDIYEYVDVYYEGDFSKMLIYRGEIAGINVWGDGGGIQYELPMKVEWLEKLGMLQEITSN